MKKLLSLTFTILALCGISSSAFAACQPCKANPDITYDCHTKQFVITNVCGQSPIVLPDCGSNNRPIDSNDIWQQILEQIMQDCNNNCSNDCSQNAPNDDTANDDLNDDQNNDLNNDLNNGTDNDANNGTDNNADDNSANNDGTDNDNTDDDNADDNSSDDNVGSDQPGNDTPDDDAVNDQDEEQNQNTTPEETPITGPNTNNTPDNSQESNQNQTVDQNESYIRQVVALVNQERSALGLNALTLESTVSAAAQLRAEECATSFSHTRPNGSSCFTALQEMGIDYRGAAENIAYGQRTPQEVVNAWMNSDGHRKNILNGKYTEIGIGYAVINGTPYWSQFFIY